MERLSQIGNHLTSAAASDAVEKAKAKNPEDAVIVKAYRTALTKGGKGKFKDINSDVLLKKLLDGLFQTLPGFDKSIIEDVVIGNVLNPGAGANEHRAAMLAAGIPSSTPFMAVNRQCSSGLMAVNDIANKVLTGQIECGLAGGSESMSQNYGPKSAPVISPEILRDGQAKKCLIPMGITSENVNEKYTIPRSDQDAFAASSYQKAEKAVKGGLFKDEILPLEVEIEADDDDDDDKEPKKTTIVVDTDEGIRPGVTAASLGKIRPAFKKDGSTHAGNASQVSDGAAVVLIMRRSLAEKLQLPVLGKYIATTIVGVPPEIMGVGPGYAIPKVLELTGIPKEAISVFEINEAFAGQALFSVKRAGIPLEKVNPRGGAIALGHPLGATGARQVATIMRELKTGELGVTSMCIGTGMGAAAIFVKE
ncbi:unnamed protein product [Kuraishia capsulata CBS 1993]|uniref:acetyl-CoA C-acyltransferase n=1 Tax=Kuraishia capsulata CBS 1993 TaxID=1382522 RepID=W6MMX2_9ASCO|nr:uncharacterized protein KUCA_T00003531001 [Kuraishia capsulata CBS 1993]CDK27553.1 unnamed protein product [Kuraishia capsulata CBS 1993]